MSLPIIHTVNMNAVYFHRAAMMPSWYLDRIKKVFFPHTLLSICGPHCQANTLKIFSMLFALHSYHCLICRVNQAAEGVFFILMHINDRSEKLEQIWLLPQHTVWLVLSNNTAVYCICFISLCLGVVKSVCQCVLVVEG